jgi:hypothetical protein
MPAPRATGRAVSTVTDLTLGGPASNPKSKIPAPSPTPRSASLCRDDLVSRTAGSCYSRRDAFFICCLVRAPRCRWLHNRGDSEAQERCRSGGRGRCRAARVLQDEPRCRARRMPVRASRVRHRDGDRHHVLGVDDGERPSGGFHRHRRVDLSVVSRRGASRGWGRTVSPPSDVAPERRLR